MSTSGEKQQDAATGCYRITMEYTGLQWITNHCSISFEAVTSQHSVGIGSPFLDAAIGHPIHFNLFQRWQTARNAFPHETWWNMMKPWIQSETVISHQVISLCIRIGILGDEAGEEDKESDRRVSKLRKDRRIAVMVPNDNATNHKLPASVPEFKAKTGFLSTTEYCSVTSSNE
jgi:hypothetical protein